MITGLCGDRAEDGGIAACKVRTAAGEAQLRRKSTGKARKASFDTPSLGRANHESCVFRPCLHAGLFTCEKDSRRSRISSTHQRTDGAKAQASKESTKRGNGRDARGHVHLRADLHTSHRNIHVPLNACLKGRRLCGLLVAN